MKLRPRQNTYFDYRKSKAASGLAYGNGSTGLLNVGTGSDCLHLSSRVTVTDGCRPRYNGLV